MRRPRAQALKCRVVWYEDYYEDFSDYSATRHLLLVVFTPPFEGALKYEEIGLEIHILVHNESRIEVAMSNEFDLHERPDYYTRAIRRALYSYLSTEISRALPVVFQPAAPSSPMSNAEYKADRDKKMYEDFCQLTAQPSGFSRNRAEAQLATKYHLSVDRVRQIITKQIHSHKQVSLNGVR